MKTLHLISTRWVLKMAFTLIGIAAFFTACEQQEILPNNQLQIEQKIPETLPEEGQTPLITDSEGELESRYPLTLRPGWNFITTISKSDLQNGTTTISVNATSKYIYLRSFRRPGDWTYISSASGGIGANSTKTFTYDSNTPMNGQDYIKVYIYHWSDDFNTTTICDIGIGFNEKITPPENITTVPFPAGFAIGLEAGDPIDRHTGANTMTVLFNDNKDRFQYLDESGAKFVRVNFYKPKSYTGSGYGWLSDYDRVINELLNRNIPIYGVVTDVVGGDSGGGETSYPTYGSQYRQDVWIDDYADGFKAITQYFSGRITHYESFNEPDNYLTEDGPAAMEATKFADLLKKVHSRVKAGGNPDDITLISGPVVAHDRGVGACGGNKYNNGACYLKQAIDKYGTAYFDAVGYHVYVNSTGGNVANGVKNSMDALEDMLDSKNLDKDVYVSEIGWDTKHVSESRQADYIEDGLEKLRDLKNSHRIKGVSLFSLSDFEAIGSDEKIYSEKFGLVSPHYMEGREKPSWDMYVNLYKGN